MSTLEERIVIYRKRLPIEPSIDEDLKWMCEALGLCGPKDKDKTCMRVFKRVIITTQDGTGVTSSELVEEFGLSRTSIVHHLNHLLQSGIVERKKSRYLLRRNNLQRTLTELQHDVQRMFENMQEIANELDRELELPRRQRFKEEER